MTKCDYTELVYKVDRRCKSGERLVSTINWKDSTEDEMRRLASALDTWANKPGYRYEYVPINAIFVF